MATRDYDSSPTQDRTWPIQIHALGGFDVTVNGKPLRFADGTPRRPLDLLKVLLSLGGQGVNQLLVSESLWPTAEGDAAYRALITTLYRLRRVLQHKDAITFTDGRLSVASDLCWVDVWAFEHKLYGNCDPSRLRQALDLYRGPYLGDHEASWAFEARDRLRRKFLRATLQLGSLYEQESSLQSAAALYERALDVESLSEDIHRRLMHCLAKLDQPSAAMDVYQRCRQVLMQYRGIAPSSATESLYQTLCRAVQA
jgi:LuxR family transcriptional regulator, maltose regulon positive regulatory protein